MAIEIVDSGQKTSLDTVTPNPPKLKVKILKIDTKYFTPLGIQNPLNSKLETDGEIKIAYEIEGEDAFRVKFEVFVGNELLFQTVHLQEVTVEGTRKRSMTEHEMKVQELRDCVAKFDDDLISQGKHVWYWDGFGDDDILDTNKLLNILTFKISAYSIHGYIISDTLKVETLRMVDDHGTISEFFMGNETVMAYNDGLLPSPEKIEDMILSDPIEWLDVRVDRSIDKVTGTPKNSIDVDLRVDLRDGGAIGVDEGIKVPIQASPYTRPVDVYIRPCPERVPASEVAKNGTPITRTSSEFRDFEALEALALKGLKYHWGRNKAHPSSIGDCILVGGERFEVNVNPINTRKNSMSSMDITFNTNNVWMRSNNPGCVSSITSFAGNVAKYIPFVPLSASTFYNVGYNQNYYRIQALVLNDEWRYIDGNGTYSKTTDINGKNVSLTTNEYNVDREFEFTVAHEIGHTILRAFAEPAGEGTDYSYKHKGSSTYSETVSVSKGGVKYPEIGEYDLMKYHNNKPCWVDFNRVVAAEDDVKGLLWTSTIKLIPLKR